MEKLSALDATNDEKVKVSPKHIPQDLAFSILSKLPIKSLKRFGCCQKSWNNLFENPNFMSMYRDNLMSNYDDSPLLFLNQPRGSVDAALYLVSGERFENRVKLDWPPAFEENYDHIFVLGSGSINGALFLIQENKIVLWNPAAEEFKVLPPSPSESVPPNWDILSDVEGFGYDHVTDDYKVIRCLSYSYFMDDGDLNISPLPVLEIYSLRNNNWRKLGDDIPSCDGIVGSQVYMDSMCHWLGGGHKKCLVSFDLSNEVFFTTPMPSDKDEIRAYTDPTEFLYDYDDISMERHLLELNGSIGLISNRAHTATFHVSILGEIGAKESWTRLYIVGPLPCIRFPMGMGQKGDIFFWKEDYELVWFNLRTQTIEYSGLKEYWFYSGTYKESPLPIGGLNN